jgi:hypothetical protein
MPQGISDTFSDELRVYVSETVFDCVALAFEETGALNAMINVLLHENLPLDNSINKMCKRVNKCTGMDLEVNVTGSEVMITSEGIEASVVIDLMFERLLPSYEKFITVSFNTSAQVEVFMRFGEIFMCKVGIVGCWCEC